jgi:hypothetical protein
MAIWQFHVYFIPKKSLLNKYQDVPAQLVINSDGWSDYFENSDLGTVPEFEDALTVHWWADLNIKLNDFVPLVQMISPLQKVTQNAEGMRNFGNADTNDISVLFNDDTLLVEEVNCRIDLRQVDKTFVRNILGLATQFDCLLMDKQGRLYQPILGELLATIKLSNANRFISDPEQFIKDISHEIVKPE